METLVTVVFVLCYLFIIFEHPLKINKSAFALLGGVLSWAVYMFVAQDHSHVEHQLLEHVSDIASILFFLMGAMTIVEMIDAHNGFEVITNLIGTKSQVKLLWIIGIITFFLSAVLDNLTTTIVMVSLLRKLIDDKKARYFFAGLVVIAANAGGAWTPIGDVTTTMLWIGGQVTTLNIMKQTFLASMVNLIVPLVAMTLVLRKSKFQIVGSKQVVHNGTTKSEQNLVFFLGIGALIFVPIFKYLTDLPPFMGMLFGLGVLWLVTELLHKEKVGEDKDKLSVIFALKRIDIPSILFFLGILACIAALQASGQLGHIAVWLDKNVSNYSMVTTIIGLLSAIVDNVPLVAASMGMYDMSVYPTDHHFWELMAYCAGTGGSILIIGSAAGVAAMGMEKIDFFWYVKNISLYALLGYFAGVLVFMLENGLLF
jgi:Na+/H+ antiporter NhaD/arsenite permease-like protein